MNIFIAFFGGVILCMVLQQCLDMSPRQLAEKHCSDVSDRHEFEKCQVGFLK